MKSKSKTDNGQVEKEIFNLLNSDAKFRSKRELIEKFIEANLPAIEDSGDIRQEFEKFWIEEQQKAFYLIVADEKLSPVKTPTRMEGYLYAERDPSRDEILALPESGQPTVLVRKKTGERILKKKMDFVETFIIGIVG
jgi:type I restriction enzyme R subunit